MHTQFNIVHPNGQQYLPVQIPDSWTAANTVAYLQQTGFLPSGNWRLILQNTVLAPNLYISQLKAYEGAALQVVRGTATAVQFDGKGKTSAIRHTLSQHPGTGQAQPEEPSSLLAALLRRLFS